MSKSEIAANAADAALKVVLDRVNTSQIQNGAFVAELRLTDEMGRAFQGRFEKTVVGCGSDIELRSIYDEAKSENIPCSLVMDSVKTETSGEPAITCTAVGPAASSKVDAITGHLKLI